MHTPFTCTYCVGDSCSTALFVSIVDDGFLLRFLRVAKFSQIVAQQRIDNFWTVRSSPTKGVPEWFSNMDPLDQKMQTFFDSG